MLTQLKKQANVRGIAANAVATCEIPTDGTHYAVYLFCKTVAGVPLTRAQMIADIGDIVLRINGDQIVEASITFLLDLQKYYGDAIGAGNVDGVIPIYFDYDHLATFAERSLFALGMAGIDSFTISVDITAIAQLSSIEVYSDVTFEDRMLGQHKRISRYPQNYATIGVQEISTMPKHGDTVAYGALHIEDSAGTIDDVTVKIGGNDIFDEVPANINTVLQARGRRTRQTGYYHVDFAKNRAFQSLLFMAGIKDFRQKITWSTAAPNNYNIYAEEIHGLKK